MTVKTKDGSDIADSNNDDSLGHFTEFERYLIDRLDGIDQKLEVLAERQSLSEVKLDKKFKQLQTRIKKQDREIARMHDDAQRLQPLPPARSGWMNQPVATGSSPEILRQGSHLTAAGEENTGMPLRRSSRYS